MKRVMLVLVVVLFACSMASAQDMMFGVKTGLSLGNVSQDVEDFDMPSDFDKKMRMGLTFGGMVHMPLGENMMFMGEAAYIQKGVKFDMDGDEVVMKMDFLQIDALVKYMFADSFGIYAGPAFGFVLSAKEDTPIGDFDIKDYVKSTEFSLSFGGQFMAAENIIVDARYNMGLTDLNDSGEGDSPEINSRTILLTVGYMF